MTVFPRKTHQSRFFRRASHAKETRTRTVLYGVCHLVVFRGGASDQRFGHLLISLARHQPVVSPSSARHQPVISPAHSRICVHVSDRRHLPWGRCVLYNLGGTWGATRDFPLSGFSGIVEIRPPPLRGRKRFSPDQRCPENVKPERTP